MILFPKCKINIGLNITSRRPDGYHNLETVMYRIDWSDVLEIVPGKTGETRLFTSGREVKCAPHDNLVMKAARALSEHREYPPVDIYLHKIVPDGAGLGGGSADAASTLVGINSLYGLGMTDDELAAIASKLGADCPFFIYGKPLLATGIGTEFQSVDIDLTGYRLALVKPAVSVPTKVAYSKVKPAAPERSLLEDLKLSPSQWLGIVKNDFEDSVFSEYPEISKIKSDLLDAGAVYAAMSGSGSAVFGIFDTDIDEPVLSAMFPDCSTHLVDA